MSLQEPAAPASLLQREGAIIALDDDQKLRWAIALVPSIRFDRYQVSFKLIQR